MTFLVRILHLGDDPLDAALVKSALEEGGIACVMRRVDTRNDFIREVA